MEPYVRVPKGTVIPPLRFAFVEAGLCRGSYPRSLNFPFLDSLRLKTIISITPEPLATDADAWAKERGIQQIHIIPERTEEKAAPLQFSAARQIVELLIDATIAPVYIHCLNGGEVTSLAICALRKLQFWIQSSIILEMERFSEIHSSSEKFVSSFGSGKADDIIRVPSETPAWLWQGLKDEKGHLPTTWADAVGQKFLFTVEYQEAGQPALQEQ